VEGEDQRRNPGHETPKRTPKRRLQGDVAPAVVAHPTPPLPKLPLLPLLPLPLLPPLEPPLLPLRLIMGLMGLSLPLFLLPTPLQLRLRLLLVLVLLVLVLVLVLMAVIQVPHEPALWALPPLLLGRTLARAILRAVPEPAAALALPLPLPRRAWATGSCPSSLPKRSAPLPLPLHHRPMLAPASPPPRAALPAAGGTKGQGPRRQHLQQQAEQRHPPWKPPRCQRLRIRAQRRELVRPTRARHRPRPEKQCPLRALLLWPLSGFTRSPHYSDNGHSRPRHRPPAPGEGRLLGQPDGAQARPPGVRHRRTAAQAQGSAAATAVQAQGSAAGAGTAGAAHGTSSAGSSQGEGGQAGASEAKTPQGGPVLNPEAPRLRAARAQAAKAEAARSEAARGEAARSEAARGEAAEAQWGAEGLKQTAPRLRAARAEAARLEAARAEAAQAEGARAEGGG